MGGLAKDWSRGQESRKSALAGEQVVERISEEVQLEAAVEAGWYGAQARKEKDERSVSAELVREILDWIAHGLPRIQAPEEQTPHQTYRRWGDVDLRGEQDLPLPLTPRFQKNLRLRHLQRTEVTLQSVEAHSPSRDLGISGAEHR